MQGRLWKFFSDHATTCSDSSSGDDAVVLPKNPHRTLVVPPGATVWKHTKLKTVHLAQEGYFRVLACAGRSPRSISRAEWMLGLTL